MKDHPIHFEPRASQSEADRKLLAQSRAIIEQSRRKLYGTAIQIDPYRLSSTLGRKAVSVTAICDEWHVTVEQDGHVSVRTFQDEQYALNYADGQRARLRLDEVERT